MPITESTKKALRQSKKKRLSNINYNKKIKDLSKELALLVSQKKMDEAKKLLPQVYKIIDKATKVNVLKKNTASRRKSKMARMAG
ncbi:MAG: 30S ribosomal protein S20 [Candidatus Nealsonbacteria bacterium CG23_combo_of_CG06-09_8_20_14_all_39_17]|uniref:Small ribosomal subunit protein bS20 n=1 Tax=Candidatus Nealsonbacteria bacterium CG23_combo_of_CG06-09_8_20_14_all_39_17 TaxID=1974722 RepID=A0A2G9YXD8_9BACT|nr:MAG: 30S ribosomal protein S20 [Candidatus Nealsonbacteria bacterium CG23_combo_of_CG06-09_8_20_14_all_39_17]PIU44162.1 MAG: 30S ribosomal protein S20 [Candidatus Nealsonbacteria bacterium CG07_land_8_20_14_0_80_39_13]